MAKPAAAQLDKVVRNLNEEIDALKERSRAGLLKAGFYAQGESQKRVPVEYGKLRASAYTRPAQSDPNKVEVGFSAEYALDIHERMEMRARGKPRPSGLGVYWGPAGQPKYLESVLVEKRKEILGFIADEAKIKAGRRP